MHRTLALLLLASVSAQNPPLTPTSNLVLDTTATQGHFAFSHIDIPSGVRVSFTGTFPVQITCNGYAAIRGRISADGSSGINAPGAVTTGSGQAGYQYPFQCGGGSYAPATNGRHRGVYGSALPFDLAGGSPGGGFVFWGYTMLSGCYPQFTVPGGGGGGTLAIECQGQLDVYSAGMVTANGYSGGLGSGSGSGGSILLRSFAGLTIHAGGAVLANDYAPGFIRLDSYAQAPVVVGTVAPPPLVLTLPYLEETQAPVIGNTWELRVAAPRGNGVTLAASFQPGSTTNQFGIIGIDLPNAIVFTFLQLPNTGHDPLATYQLAISNDPGLIGIHLYVAGLDWLTTLPPRYTNTISTTVQ